MVEVYVSKNNCYEVKCQEEVVLTAKRTGSLTDKVTFSDELNHKIAVSTQRYFLMFDLGHKVTFFKEKKTYFLRSKKASKIFEIEGDKYEIKFGLLNRNPELYLNGVICGSYKKTEDDLNGFECKIVCENSEQCKIFSMMEIILDWFDVN